MVLYEVILQLSINCLIIKSHEFVFKKTHKLAYPMKMVFGPKTHSVGN